MQSTADLLELQLKKKLHIPETALRVDNTKLEALGQYFKEIWFDEYRQRIYLDELCFGCPQINYILYTLNAELDHADYRFNTAQDLVMIDVGLHIGSTSILKARESNIKKIYAYEPVQATYEYARKNIELNPRYMDKIETFQYGLSNENKTMEINYNPNTIGAVSTNFDNVTAYGHRDCPTTAEIELRDVNEVLGPIFEKHEEKIFLKVDCEGGEHDIFERLNDSGLLKKVSIAFFEWHFKEPDRLLEIFRDNGFICFERYHKGKFGLMHAIKLS